MTIATSAILKAANILSLVGVVFTVIYGEALADPSLAKVAGDHPTLLSPNRFVGTGFGIVEFLLLSGFCWVQYRSVLDKPVIEGVSVWLVLANVLSIVWTFLFLNEKFISAAIITGLQWVVLQIPLRNFNQHISLTSPLHNDNVAYFFVRVPMSLYAGWVLPDVFYSISVAYTHAPPDDDPKTYKILAAVFLVLIGLGGLKARKDVYYVIAIATYLIGVGIQQHTEPLITWVSLAMGTLGLLTAGVYKYRSWRRSREQEPLLGY